MIKLLRLFVICTIGVALAAPVAAWAQSYTPVDYGNYGITLLIGGPNPQGTSVGAYYNQEGSLFYIHGFALSSQGAFTAIDYPGARLTEPSFISPQGVVVGQYAFAYQPWHGFVLYGGQYHSVDSDYPGTLATVLAAISPSGEIVGSSCLEEPRCLSGRTKSFIISKDGVFTHFDPPGTDPSLGSTAAAINPSGGIVGGYFGTDGRLHGYLLKDKRFTSIDYPGAVGTFSGGVNAYGTVVGTYWNDDGVLHSYVFSNGTFTSFDPPGATNYNSQATGINNDGVVIGVFVDADFIEHGYIRTPY